MTWALDKSKCLKCGGCVAVCPVGALELVNFPEVSSKCTSCQTCQWTCPVRAIKVEK
ncbi:MAG: 4Fe-4S binding protein [Candidatus Aenigmatarchaeota archaeon]